MICCLPTMPTIFAWTMVVKTHCYQPDPDLDVHEIDLCSDDVSLDTRRSAGDLGCSCPLVFAAAVASVGDWLSIDCV